MSNLLVTGGAGFIGVNFVKYWLKQHPNDLVVNLDALTYAGNKASMDDIIDHPQHRFVQGSITDETLIEQLMLEHRIDIIVNFAAESHVDRSITGPDVFIHTNILGTYTLLKVAKKLWLDATEGQAVPHRFHHVSTDEVFGTLSDGDAAFTEHHGYYPNSPYSASKAASDHLVRAYHHTYNMNVTTSNCSNNYGPYQFPEKLIPLVLANILHNKALPVYGTGKNIRDWLYVEDHAKGIERVILKGVAGEVYNIGGNNEKTNIDIVNTLCNLLDQAFKNDPSLVQRYPNAAPAQGIASASLIEYVTDRKGHDWRYAIDAQKIEQQLGFSPSHTFETGIEKTVQWYLENPQWWLPLYTT